MNSKDMGDDTPLTRRDLQAFMNDLRGLIKPLRNATEALTSTANNFVFTNKELQGILQETSSLLRRQHDIFLEQSAFLNRRRQWEENKREIGLGRLRLRIVEEPLTAQNLAVIVLTLTELHTKCRLFEQGRIPELFDFPETHNTSFEDEANLVIIRISHSSPTILDVLLASTSIAGAIKIALDAIVQVHLRYKSVKLDTRKKELEIKQQEREGRQSLRRSELEILRQELEIEREWLALEEKHLQQKCSGIADKVVDRLSPNVDARTKERLVSSLVPPLKELQMNSVGLDQASSLQEDELD